LKKPTDSVQFRFYKPKTEKTESNQTQTKKPEKNEPNRKKPSQNEKTKPDQFEPVLS